MLPAKRVIIKCIPMVVAFVISLIPIFFTFSQSGGIKDIEWNTDGRLAIGYTDGTVQILDSDGQLINTFQVESGIYTTIDWSPIENKIAIASNGTISVVDATTGDASLVHQSEPGGLLVKWSPSGNQIATDLTSFATGPYIGLLDPSTGDLLDSFGGFHKNDLTAIEWSPDGNRIASGDSGGFIVIWDVSTGEALVEWDANTGNWIRAIAWSPDGSKLATTTDFTPAQVWNAALGQELYVLSNSVEDIAWSPDGTRLAGVGSRNVIVWDATNGEVLYMNSEGYQKSIIAWSPDSSKLAYDGTVDDTIQIVPAPQVETPTETPTATYTPTETPTATPTPTAVVLTPLNLQGWTFTPFGIPPVYSFVLGPGTPPSGSGSLSILISVSGSKLIMRPPLTNISTVSSLLPLRYSTYRSTSLASQFYVNLYLDTDGNTATCETRLDHAPTSSNLNTWETWEAGTGTWLKKSGTCFGSGTFTNVSLSQYETATVLSVAFNMGDTASSYVTFNGAIDTVTIGNVTYDFELVP